MEIITCSIDTLSNPGINKVDDYVDVLFDPALKHKLETIRSLKVTKGKLSLLMNAVKQHQIILAVEHVTALERCIDDLFLDVN